MILNETSNRYRNGRGEKNKCCPITLSSFSAEVQRFSTHFSWTWWSQASFWTLATASRRLHRSPPILVHATVSLVVVVVVVADVPLSSSAPSLVSGGSGWMAPRRPAVPFVVVARGSGWGTPGRIDLLCPVVCRAAFSCRGHSALSRRAAAQWTHDGPESCWSIGRGASVLRACSRRVWSPQGWHPD